MLSEISKDHSNTSSTLSSSPLIVTGKMVFELCPWSLKLTTAASNIAVAYPKASAFTDVMLSKVIDSTPNKILVKVRPNPNMKQERMGFKYKSATEKTLLALLCK